MRYQIALMDDDAELIGILEVCQITGMGNAHIFRLIRAGLFPPRVRKGDGGWIKAEVAAWSEQQNAKIGDR